MKFKKLLVTVLLSIAAGIVSGQVNVPLFVSGNSGSKSSEGSMAMLSVTGQNAVGLISDATFSVWAGLLAPLAHVSTDAGFAPLNVTQLSQNYPNPFRKKTAIPFEMVRHEKVTLTVFSVLGQPVRILVNKHMPPGKHIVDFDAGELSPGLFFYTLHIGDYRSTRNMVLTK